MPLRFSGLLLLRRCRAFASDPVRELAITAAALVSRRAKFAGLAGPLAGDASLPFPTSLFRHKAAVPGGALGVFRAGGSKL